MVPWKKARLLAYGVTLMAAAISAGCGRVNSGKRIVRIALGQSESHPEYLGLAAFKEYVEKELGD